MKTTDLIQAILREADLQGNTVPAYDIMRPLKSFGQVWFARGHWWFSEQHAEISTYTANGYSSNFFNESEFAVIKPDDEIEVKWEASNVQ